MLSRSHENLANIIEAFNLKPRYLDDLQNIDNDYAEKFVSIKLIPLIPKHHFRF